MTNFVEKMNDVVRISVTALNESDVLFEREKLVEFLHDREDVLVFYVSPPIHNTRGQFRDGYRCYIMFTYAVGGNEE